MTGSRLARPIAHQMQPTPVCCTATCIAMAVGIPVGELGVPLDQAFGLLDFGVWLADRQVWLRYLDRGERFRPGHLYLLSVRSLNNIGGDHAVLLDTRDCSCEPPDAGWCQHWRTLDPNEGIEGKKIYYDVNEYYAIKACELKDRAGCGAGIP